MSSNSLFIVTGASRGIGKAITHALIKSKVFMKGNVDFILSSTNITDLQAAKASLEQVLQQQSYDGDIQVNFHLHAFDFGNLEQLEANIKTLFDFAASKQFDHVCLMMNHGSLGGLDFIENVASDVSRLTNAINVNVTSCIVLCSMLIKEFNNRSKRMDIVNISSLAAIKAFESWGVYCIGKAARNMLIQAIAQESAQYENCAIKALNYAPGPVDTDMQKEIRTTAPVEEQRQIYTSLFETGKLVTCEQTTSKLISILEKNEFKNGDHLDYYDS